MEFERQDGAFAWEHAMNLDFSPEDLAFRDEVRTFIAAHYPDSLRGKQDEGEELAKEDFLAWHRVLAAKGWVNPAWPTLRVVRAGPRPSAIFGAKSAPLPIRLASCLSASTWSVL